MNSLQNISDFHVAGISFRNADAETRSRFAINAEQYALLLATAKQNSVSEFFVVSTCNRTEIYGFAPSAEHLGSFLCTAAEGNAYDFTKLAYTKRGQHAIQHLLQVAAGLDSQILGDYEIVSQIKQSFKTARANDCAGLFTEKLLDNTLRASRNIRMQTHLSSGSVSVAFAAMQFIKQHFAQIENQKILLLGIGKIGRNACKNIKAAFGASNIVLINRTFEKAEQLASELGVQAQPIENLAAEAASADVILVATNAKEPTLLPQHLSSEKPQLVLDLSIPNNADLAIAQMSNVRLADVDELSKTADETLAKRRAEVPKALQIIEDQLTEFKNWYLMRKHVPVIKAVKTKLENLQQQHAEAGVGAYDSDRIQKVLNNMASQMRTKNEGGCNFISAINEFISPQ